MILLKIAMVGVAIAAMMGVARDQQWFERAGVVGVCMRDAGSVRPEPTVPGTRASRGS